MRTVTAAKFHLIFPQLKYAKSRGHLLTTCRVNLVTEDLVAFAADIQLENLPCSSRAARCV